MTYKPPFHLTPAILKRSQEIFRELGILAGSKLDISPIKLRKLNNIKTIQASLAIEGNTLNLDQVTHVFEGKKVIGPQKDIREVQNAIEVYNNLTRFNPISSNDFLEAHNILMKNLTPSAGKWRVGEVGIFKGKEITHLPPPAKRVLNLMVDLFEFLEKDSDTTWLLKACIFHYELEFIHPFADGNGRMGRLWQQLILMKADPVFEYITVEELIKENQEMYYEVLSECDKSGDFTKFIEFSLVQILKALQNYSQTSPLSVKDVDSRLNYAALKVEKEWFSRRDYLMLHKNISSATASRDLYHGVEQSILAKKGEKNQALYRFK